MSIYDIFSDQEQDSLPIMLMTIGIVTNIDDPENKGRIKVKLINRTTSDYETDYIRMMTQMAGKECGICFIPDVGDEVLVGFCDGDIHRPYILGSLWNKESIHPIKIKDSKNDLKMIKTTTGHTILFSEEKDKEGINILTSKGMSILFSDKDESINICDKDKKTSILLDTKNEQIIISTEKKIDISVKNCNVLIDDKDISLTSKGKISLDAQDIKLSAKNNIEISGSNLKLKAKSSGELKANAKLDLSASGPVNLKGAMVKIN